VSYSINSNKMQNPPPVPSLLIELAEFPASLSQALAPTHVHWRWRPSPDAWSLVEIVCHLRDVEREVHQSRFQRMLETENPFISGVDADQWAGPRDYFRQDGHSALAGFIAARGQTLALLKDLPAAASLREARHAFFGQTTLHELLNLVVQHDRVHWQQVQLNIQREQNLAGGRLRPDEHQPEG
jgi:hypothetical protein